MNMKAILRQLFIFSGIMIAGMLVLQFACPQILYDKVWWLFLFFFFLTLSSLFVIGYATDKSPKNFMLFYFAAMIVRLFISILVAAVIILADKSHVFIFAINFTFLYLLFLGFEIYSILTNLRQHFGTGSD